MCKSFLSSSTDSGVECCAEGAIRYEGEDRDKTTGSFPGGRTSVGFGKIFVVEALDVDLGYEEPQSAKICDPQAHPSWARRA
jgi:hypothetical protein